MGSVLFFSRLAPVISKLFDFKGIWKLEFDSYYSDD